MAARPSRPLALRSLALALALWHWLWPSGSGSLGAASACGIAGYEHLDRCFVTTQYLSSCETSAREAVTLQQAAVSDDNLSARAIPGS